MPPSGPRHKPGKGARPSQNSHPSRTSTVASTPAELRSAGSTNLAFSNFYLTVNLDSGRPLSNSVVEDALDGQRAAMAVPSSGLLRDMHGAVKATLMEKLDARGDACDRLVRELARRRKERIERNRERERARRAIRDAEERTKKKVSRKRERAEERSPGLTVGQVEAKTESRPSDSDNPDDGSGDASVTATGSAGNNKSTSNDSADAFTKDGNDDDDDDEDGDEDEAGDDGGEAVTAKFTFGPNPVEFPDPTVYEVQPIDETTTDEMKRRIYSVAGFPPSDLADLIPGVAPDKDYSNAKPTNQVSAQAFANYVESYIRPLTEEDLNFLRERGDRLTPFVIPARGRRHYKDVWADEDGAMSVDSDNDNYPANEPRGTADLLDDDVAETDQVSLGPVFSRLMMAMLPDRPPASGSDSSDSGVHTAMTDPNPSRPSSVPPSQVFPPACAISDGVDLAGSFPGPAVPLAAPMPAPTFERMEDRVLAELRHIGFIDDSTGQAEFDSHFDDDVAARLRVLQEELRHQSLINGARKARLLEVAEVHMAMQEYNNIADDLDSQLNAAYLKRSRALGKGKKNVKRGPSAAAGGPSAPAAIGDSIRALMERRQQWKSVIGPVFDPSQVGLPTETIFDSETMTRLIERENATWADGGDEDDQDDEGVAV